jgi:plasmid rolling circle replication initiator protein Rep
MQGKIRSKKIKNMKFLRSHDYLKGQSVLLSESFARLGLSGFSKRSSKVSSCGSFLIFKRILGDARRKLISAEFCKDRLCPVCMVRRARRMYSEVSDVMDALEVDMKGEGCRFIFLTLTIRNVEADELGSSLDKLFSGFERLIRRKEIAGIAGGWFRSLEVTHGWERDDYHPHLHMIMQVPWGYFDLWRGMYLSRRKLQGLWRNCMGLDYAPDVHVCVVRDRGGNAVVMGKDKLDAGKAIAEVAKYTLKSSDYIADAEVHGHYDNARAQSDTDRVVSCLAFALKGRRLTAMGGSFKEKLSKLKVRKRELFKKSLDLPVMRADVDYVLETYNWSCIKGQKGRYKLSLETLDADEICDFENNAKVRMKDLMDKGDSRRKARVGMMDARFSYLFDFLSSKAGVSLGGDELDRFCNLEMQLSALFSAVCPDSSGVVCVALDARIEGMIKRRMVKLEALYSDVLKSRSCLGLEFLDGDGVV